MTRFTGTGRARLLGIGILAAVFAAGGLAGAAFGGALNAAPASEVRVPDGWHCHPRGEKKHSLLDELDLSPEQRARVDSVMARRRAETEAFWQGEGRRMRAIVDSARAEVRAVLTPAQRAEYDRLRAEHRARRGEREPQDGRGSPASPADATRKP